MKKKNKERNSYLITALGSLIVILVIYILKKVAPFGSHSLLTIDFFHQYGPMLGELYNRIINHDTLIYSFTMGNGLPFFRNFFNYLSSPLNIIMLLFKHKHLLTSYSVIIGLKTIISSLTMLFYLNNKFKPDYKFIPLAILYAFNAYFVAYYWNIMWMDGIYMLPLVALGIEWLIDKKKPLLYIISLACMLFINYFIGFMVCMFSVIYFIAYMIITIKKVEFKVILPKIKMFILSSLLAGGLCAFFFIPLFMALRGISATGDAWPAGQYYDFSLIELFFNHFSGVTSTVLKSDIKSAPNISCGTVIFVLLFAFLLNGKIPKKTKICYMAILVFLTISFYLGPLDYIWHAMHVPNDLPFRYSFIYCFILTVMAGYAIYEIKNLEKRCAILILSVNLAIVSAAKLSNLLDFETFRFTVNAAIIIVSYLLYAFYNFSKNKKIMKYLFIVFFIMAVTDCILTINNNWNIDQEIHYFNDDYDELHEIAKSIKTTDEDKFYRMGQIDTLTFNDPSWYGYYGNVAFSSMEYESTAKLLYNFGIPGNEINSYYFKDTTPIYNLLFDIKYVLGDVDSDKFYEKYYESDKYRVYQSKYNLGLMYGVNDDITLFKDAYDPIVNQANFIYYATGIDDVFEVVEDVHKETVYDDGERFIVKYSVKSDYNNLYFYMNKYYQDFVCVNDIVYYANNNYFNVYDYNEFNVYGLKDYSEKYVISIPTDSEYIDFYVGYNTYIEDNFIVYRLNNDKFLSAYNYLDNNRVKINNFKETRIKATSNTEKEMIIYTSISYDKGWQVYIDGEKVETIKLLDAMLGFKVPKGKHTIELRYRIEYMSAGMFISVVSLIVLIIVYGKNNYLKQIKKYIKKRCHF